mgnify:CR=1 FL=1
MTLKVKVVFNNIQCFDFQQFHLYKKEFPRYFLLAEK